jgi:hypothetical protein
VANKKLYGTRLPSKELLDKLKVDKDEIMNKAKGG